MNFAVLGSAPLALELSRQLASAGEDRVVAASDVPAEILACPEIDVLVLATSAAEALSAAERLSEKTSLIVVPDRGQGSAFAYSLVLHDQDGRTVLMPAFSARFDSRLRTLRETLRSGVLGRFVSARFERVSAAGPSGGDMLFPAEEAERAILADVDALRFLLGEFNKVSAVPAGAGGGLASLTITFGSAAGQDVLWTFRRGDRSGAELEIHLEQGTCIVRWGAEGVAEVRIQSETLAAPSPPEVADRVLAEFRQAHASPAASREATWTDYVRAMDLVDAVARSMRRRRTIDLHLEETSERNQFKTQMTAIGCAVAGLTLMGFFALLTVGAMLDPRDAQQRVAEGAGLVLHQGGNSRSDLDDSQLRELERIRANYRVSPTAILVEGMSSEDAAAESRRKAVVADLLKAGYSDAETRVVIRPLRGQWFERGLAAGWILLFAPLGAFLLLQVLLGITRSGTEAAASSTKRQDAGARDSASDESDPASCRSALPPRR